MIDPDLLSVVVPSQRLNSCEKLTEGSGQRKEAASLEKYLCASFRASHSADRFSASGILQLGTEDKGILVLRTIAIVSSKLLTD